MILFQSQFLCCASHVFERVVLVFQRQFCVFERLVLDSSELVLRFMNVTEGVSCSFGVFMCNNLLGGSL